MIAVDTSDGGRPHRAARGPRAALADGRQPGALERIGAKGADAGVVSTGDDITASILGHAGAARPRRAGRLRKVISRGPRPGDGEAGRDRDDLPRARVRPAAGRAAVGAAPSSTTCASGTGFSMQEMAVPIRGSASRCGSWSCGERFRISVIAAARRAHRPDDPGARSGGAAARLGHARGGRRRRGPRAGREARLTRATQRRDAGRTQRADPATLSTRSSNARRRSSAGGTGPSGRVTHPV